MTRATATWWHFRTARRSSGAFAALVLVVVLSVAAGLSCPWTALAAEETKTVSIRDALGREQAVPLHPERVLCSGSGCLRLLVYLGAQDRVVAVDSIEHRTGVADARPYAVANPQFRDLPLFGEFRGQDNPELIAGLDPQPQLIFKTYSESGYDAVQLQEKTGIPVVVLDYGDLGRNRSAFYETLRLMGTVLGVEERAEAVIRFFEEAIADLMRRAGDVPEAERRSCYVGGIGSRGTHGFQSTEPGYPPFLFLSARNVAADPARGDKQLRQADIAKEQLLLWDPELVFLDLGTLGSGKEANGLIELRTDPVYRSLSAVSGGDVHGVLPYNSYTTNYGSVLADAYFIGTVLYPDRFADVRPEAKADEIYTFLVGKPLFAQLDEAFEGLVFKKIPLEE